MKGQKKLPTGAELEILEILWHLKKATVREVYEAISEHKKVVYTSTLKTMQKMIVKKLVGRTPNTQAHIYFPLVKEEDVKHNTVKDVINRFFKGSWSGLALHALGNSKANDENLDELIKMVNNLKNQKN